MTRRDFIEVMSAILGVPLVLGAVFAALPDSDGAVRLFHQAVERYMKIREAVERELMPFEVFDDPQRIEMAADARGDGIRRARAAARQGDVFTAEVTTLFRARIHRVFAGNAGAVAALLEEMEEEDEPLSPPLVNGPFAWAAAVGTPPAVLAVLPPLPEALQYRFVGFDLVLLDVDANLVVDVLPGALPGSGRGVHRSTRSANRRALSRHS